MCVFLSRFLTVTPVQDDIIIVVVVIIFPVLAGLWVLLQLVPHCVEKT